MTQLNVRTYVSVCACMCGRLCLSSGLPLRSFRWLMMQWPWPDSDSFGSCFRAHTSLKMGWKDLLKISHGLSVSPPLWSWQKYKHLNDGLPLKKFVQTFVSQKMNHNDFDDPLTIPLEPPWGWDFCFIYVFFNEMSHHLVNRLRWNLVHIHILVHFGDALTLYLAL